jgi:hypothetical protein
VLFKYFLKTEKKINRKRVMETLGPSPKAIFIEFFVAHLLYLVPLLQIYISWKKSGMASIKSRRKTVKKETKKG